MSHSAIINVQYSPLITADEMTHEITKFGKDYISVCLEENSLAVKGLAPFYNSSMKYMSHINAMDAICLSLNSFSSAIDLGWATGTAGRTMQGFMHIVNLFVDEGVENGNVNHSIMGEFYLIKIGGEDIFESDLMRRRLIRSVLGKSLVALKSSQGFIVL